MHDRPKKFSCGKVSTSELPGTDGKEQLDETILSRSWVGWDQVFAVLKGLSGAPIIVGAFRKFAFRNKPPWSLEIRGTQRMAAFSSRLGGHWSM